MAISLQQPLSSVPKVAFVERFNYLLGKDSLPHNLFILVMQHGAHCVTRQKWLSRRLRNLAIWLHISEILFYKWTGLDWYMIVHKGCFPSSKTFVWNFRNSMCQTYIPVVQSQPKPLHICSLYTVIVSRIQKSSTEDNSFVKLKGTFWFDLPK